MLLSLWLACACKQNEAIPANELFLIRQGRDVNMPMGLTFRSDTITVTVCPPNAYCIAPNFVSVSLQVTRGTFNQQLRLFAPTNNYKRIANAIGDSSGLVIDGMSYKIILRDGYYETSSANIPSGAATIQVSRL